ncbi:class I SAM-dependent methyltransferase [Saliphagus sp. GCM10025308]
MVCGCDACPGRRDGRGPHRWCRRRSRCSDRRRGRRRPVYGRNRRRRLRRPRGAVVDAERLPFARDAFDAATCRIAAHHFPNPTAFVNEASRVLESGGTLALEDNVAPPDPTLGEFINRVERLRDPTHVESYTVEQWHEWLREAGFALEETVQLRKQLEFESWADGQSCTGEERKRVERTLREATDEAAETFDIRVEDGRVVSFAPCKALIRARRLE